MKMIGQLIESGIITFMQFPAAGLQLHWYDFCHTEIPLALLKWQTQ